MQLCLTYYTLRNWKSYLEEGIFSESLFREPVVLGVQVLKDEAQVLLEFDFCVFSQLL